MLFGCNREIRAREPDLPAGSPGETRSRRGSGSPEGRRTMKHRRRPRADLRRAVQLAIAAVNAVASLLDALRKLR